MTKDEVWHMAEIALRMLKTGKPAVQDVAWLHKSPARAAYFLRLIECCRA